MLLLLLLLPLLQKLGHHYNRPRGENEGERLFFVEKKLPNVSQSNLSISRPWTGLASSSILIILPVPVTFSAFAPSQNNVATGLAIAH